jgi:chemotaxis protein CheX
MHGPALELFSPENLEHMDETVREVFGVMLGTEIVADAAAAPVEDEHITRLDQTAFVGFAGIISGLCQINLSIPASITITSAMLGGVEVEPGSELICDGIGELCNLLAGGWKNRLPELAAKCSLSMPTVIEGSEYQIHRPPNVLMHRRSYIFGEEHLLLLTLIYDPG